MNIKPMSFATEVAILVDEHRISVQEGPGLSIGTAQLCLEELLERGYRELARL